VGAFSEIFVDPNLDSDTGTGTLADPFGDLEYGIKNTVFDTSNGTVIHLKSGAYEVLSEDLYAAFTDTSVTAAWVTSAGQPAVLRGYDGVGYDGGKAGIDGAGAHGLFGAANQNYVHCIDLHVQNCGAEIPIKVAAGSSVLRCYVDETTQNGIHVTNYCMVMGCLVRNPGGHGIALNGTGSAARYNRVEDGNLTMTSGIYAFGSEASGNIITIGANSNATGIIGASAPVVNNSVYCFGGGTGIGIRASSAARHGTCLNNLVEGLNGVGGRGIYSESTAGRTHAIGGNAMFDCTTPYLHDQPVVEDFGDNEILTASPFTDAANGDFSPVDLGNIREGHVPGGWFV